MHLAEAEIRNARLNLDYTTVVAPASGVTALQSPPVGTLIQAQQTLLTTIKILRFRVGEREHDVGGVEPCAAS